MAHERLWLVTATPQQLDLAVAGILLAMVLGAAFLIWSRRNTKKKLHRRSPSSKAGRKGRRKRQLP